MGMEDGPEKLDYTPWMTVYNAQPIDGLCRSCGSSRRGSREFESNTHPYRVNQLLIGWECTSCDTFGYQALPEGTE